MNTNNDYKIKSVEVSTNGVNEIYLDVEWEGNQYIDYYELRVSDRNHNVAETLAYASHKQRVILKDFYLDLNWKDITNEVFYVEIGIGEYTEKGEQLSWQSLAAYEPIPVNIYREPRIFRKNILELR